MARRHIRWFFWRVRQKSGKAFAQLHFKKKAASDKQFYSGAKDLKTINNIKLQNCAYMSLPLQLNGFFLLVPSPLLQVISLIRPFLYNILTLPSTEIIYLIMALTLRN